MKIINDPATLVPAFRAKVELLLDRMRAKGWKPLLYETRRSRERAKMLNAKGRGSLDSMHCYDIAADIVDADRNNVPRMDKEGLWDAPAQFWADLEDEAIALGLHRLFRRGVKHDRSDADGESWDKPHVQAVPVKEQAAIRALRSRDEIAEYVRQRLEG